MSAAHPAPHIPAASRHHSWGSLKECFSLLVRKIYFHTFCCIKDFVRSLTKHHFISLKHSFSLLLKAGFYIQLVFRSLPIYEGPHEALLINSLQPDFNHLFFLQATPPEPPFRAGWVGLHGCLQTHS